MSDKLPDTHNNVLPFEIKIPERRKWIDGEINFKEEARRWYIIPMVQGRKKWLELGLMDLVTGITKR